MNALDELALKVAKEMPEGFLWYEGCGWEAGVLNQEVLEFTHRLVAELAKQEPVAWRYIDSSAEGTCCYVYNEMKQGEPLYAAPVIPAGWGIVGYLDGRSRFFYADDPQMIQNNKGMRECYAAAPKGE